MGEFINKEFEEYQKQLEIREKKLKDVVKFLPPKNLDIIINELKDKTIKL